MQAPFEATDGRARLAAIISSFPPDSPHWNEAQNRFQFVDRLLTECLGWERPYIQVESSDEFGGKADYVLGSNPPKAVLEAKREAKVFKPTSPVAVETRAYVLKTVGRHDEAIAEYRKALQMASGSPELQHEIEADLHELGAIP